MADGKHASALASSQDHKARDNGDKGPNTGGMGAYSPAPIVTQALQERVMETVIYPTLEGLAQQGTPYRGFLYAGLMISPSGDIQVLEFNCRLGDPETQPIMMRLQSDLVELCLAGTEQRLDKVAPPTWDPRTCLGVVMATKGYPDAYPKGDIIEGLLSADDTNQKVFHAGSVLQQGQIKTAGGRILCVTALGDGVLEAQQRAYAAVKSIHWPNAYYRTDIGYRAINEQHTVSNH
jgi:phosphoribosylamine--glycine ligase